MLQNKKNGVFLQIQTQMMLAASFIKMLYN